MNFEGSTNVKGGDSMARDEKNTGSNVFQLKGNKIPSHLISLERLFDRHDAYIKREREKKVKTCDEYDGINIGTEINPKMINIGKCCTSKERVEIKKLLIEFQDVFAWSYEDLKNFMGGKFKHKILLKPEATPYR